MKRAGVTWRYRLGVAARVIAAAAGGYGVAALVAIAAAQTLPGARVDTAAFGTIAGLLAWPVAAIGVFAARSTARALVGIAGFATLFAGLALAGGWRP